MSRSQWAVALALPALVLAVAPWSTLPGDGMRIADQVAAFLPLAPVLALVALAVAGRRMGAALPALATLGLTALTLVGERVSPLPAPPPPSAVRPSAGTRLVIVSQNVWVGNVDPGGTLARLAGSDADVVLLQEVDGTVAPLLDRLRARYPFGSRCGPRCSTAIFSRWPMERVRYRFRDVRGRPFGPGLVQTRIRVPGIAVPVPVVSIHLSRRAGAGQLVRDTDTLVAALARRPSPATIMAGDFNLPGWAPSMRRLESGLFPLVRATRGDPTYPARLARWAWPVPLVAIDHLFAGPGWRVAGIRVLPAGGSDHHPVRVELVWHG